MILGFKTGPKTWEEGKRIIAEDNPALCELWFNVNKADEYDAYFSLLKKHNIQVGLHYWGIVGNDTKSNLATNNNQVRGETVRQIRKTIDIASRHKCAYVNIHPGARMLERIDFDKEEQSPIQDSKTPENESKRILFESVFSLHAYAQQKNVLLMVETLPAREAIRYTAPDKTYNPHNVNLDTMYELAQRGIWIANDITHTATWSAVQRNSFDTAWDNLMEFSRKAAPRTRLIHVNTMKRSPKGNDTHDGMLDEDFERGVFPNRQQLRELLALFKNRDDAYAIPEPHSSMQRNYCALLHLVPVTN